MLSAEHMQALPDFFTDIPDPRRGQGLRLVKYDAGEYLGYEITALLLWKNYWILNLDNDSIFFSPILDYSFSANV